MLWRFIFLKYTCFSYDETYTYRFVNNNNNYYYYYYHYHYYYNDIITISDMSNNAFKTYQ